MFASIANDSSPQAVALVLQSHPSIPQTSETASIVSVSHGIRGSHNQGGCVYGDPWSSGALS